MPRDPLVPCAAAQIRRLSRPAWLVLGKGPTFDRLGREHLTDRGVLTLNHAACELTRRFPDVDFLAHFTDWEACRDCLPALDPNRATLVLPWYPHLRCRVSRMSLPQRLSSLPRQPPFCSYPVWSYRSSLSGRLPAPSWLARVRVRLFSAVAAVNLLAAGNVKKIRTLGVDGGSSYASAFDDKDRLANGQRSFDCQWVEIRSAVVRHGLDLDKEF